MKSALRFGIIFLLSVSLLSVSLPSIRQTGENAAAALKGWISAHFELPRIIVMPYRYSTLLLSPAPEHLPVPVDGVAAARLYNSWGAPRPGRRTHQGIDIFAARNTPVRSTTDGIVVRVGTNTLGGRIVSVAGPGGQVHYYAHLERYGDRKVFDWVKQGDIIGYVGNSGNARTTPPHLHYGIYTVGGAIDPYPLLARSKSKNLNATSRVSRPSAKQL